MTRKDLFKIYIISKVFRFFYFVLAAFGVKFVISIGLVIFGIYRQIDNFHFLLGIKIVTQYDS